MSPRERQRRAAHRRWMEVYWCAAQAWWETAEHVTMMYQEELEQYKARHPQPTFKQYMRDTKGQPR